MVPCSLPQYFFIKLGIIRPEKRKMAILNNVSGVLKPGRTTLLLGPPAAGKSTLLKALAGKLQHGSLKVCRAAKLNEGLCDNLAMSLRPA